MPFTTSSHLTNSQVFLNDRSPYCLTLDRILHIDHKENGLNATPSR